MKTRIKEIILENQNKDLPVAISRNIQIPPIFNIIITLIGARRSGNYILYKENICWCNKIFFNQQI